jgi:hypothetical protein
MPTPSRPSSPDWTAFRWHTFVLASVAMLAAAEAQSERALRLDGAALAVAETLGTALTQPIPAQRSAMLSRAREEPGSARAEAVTIAGRTATLDRAVAVALAWLGPALDHPPGC